MAIGALLLAWITPWRLAPVPAVGLALMILTGVLAVPALRQGATDVKLARDSLETPNAAVGLDKCLYAGDGSQVELARQLRSRIPPDDSFAVETLPVDRPCFQLNVLPRRLVRSSDDPEWTLQGAPFTPELQGRMRRERALPEARRRVLVLGPGRVLVRNR